MSEKIDPYVLSTRGNTLIIRDKLITIEEDKQALIFVGDKIKTLDSTATVFWPDGSITRLGEKSSITIHEMRAETVNANIQVDFSLEQGKTWSNVIKYYFWESYFHERFNNDTALAAVRWTVFEVNLEKKYVHTIDHAVSLEDIWSHTGSTFVVAGGVFDTDTRKILAQTKIDTAWNTVNNNADIIYLNGKMEAFNKAIIESVGKYTYIDILLQKLGLQKTDPSLEVLLTGGSGSWEQFKSEMKTAENNEKLMDIYQQIYGLKNTDKLLNAKMELRDLIIETAPADKKKDLLDDFARSTLYDSWNTLNIGTGSIEWLQKKLEEYMKQWADISLIDSLKKAANGENIQKLNNALESTKQTIIKTLTEKDLLEEAKKKMTPENLEKINSAADSVRNSVLDEFKKLTQ